MKKRKAIVTLCMAMMLGSALTSYANIPTSNQQTTGDITFVEGTNDDTYSVYRILNATTSSDDGSFTEADVVSYTLNPKYEAILKEVTGQQTEDAIISEIEGYSAEQMETFAETLYNKIIGSSLSADASGNGADGISDLPYGYYLIKDTSAESDMKSSNIILSVLTGDVEITTKEDDVPVIDKSIVVDGENLESVTAGFGDTVNFLISVDIPERTDTFIIYDAIDDGLQIDEESFEITIGDSNTPFDAFSVEDASEDFDYQIVFTPDSLAQYAGQKLYVHYSATVLDTAIIGSDGNTNAASLEYNNDPYEDITVLTPPDEVKVYSLKLRVNKINNQSEPLSGASFILYKTLPDGDNPGDEVGRLTYSEENDYLYINGLNTGTYYLVEEIAPNGYNLLDEPITLTITATTPENVTVGDERLTSLDINITDPNNATTKVDAEIESGEVEVNVVNLSGVELPTTGGMGTIIFYGTGLVLMVGAIAIIKGKKKNK